MQTALRRGGLDQRLDAGESEFGFFRSRSPREIDLTREGGAYVGEKIIISTCGHRIAYRPSSDVLVFSSGEARPFERVPARDVQRGDEILVLDEQTRERIRQALATSRSILAQLADYHTHVARLRETLAGSGIPAKAREVLRRMREIDPSLPDSEVGNVKRWLTADLAAPPRIVARANLGQLATGLVSGSSCRPTASMTSWRRRMGTSAVGASTAVIPSSGGFAVEPARGGVSCSTRRASQRDIESSARFRGLWLSLFDGGGVTRRRCWRSREEPPVVSEPRALRDMYADERQLLKEAVCDAILERDRPDGVGRW